jgi:alpha-tubulin suppressor-like RCC1 family protein
MNFFSNIFIVDVCGSDHFLSISNKGEIYCWGSNEFGKLGNGKSGNYENQLTPY